MRIARSTCSAIACASSSDRSPGSFRWSESSRPASTATTLTLCTSRTRGTASAAACARSRTACSSPRGSTWTTTSASGSAACTARSTSSAAAWPWPTACSRETPITTSAKYRPAAWRIRSRRSSTGGSIAAIARRAVASSLAGTRSISTSTLRRISLTAADEHERRDEQRRDRVGVRVPGADEQQADEHRDRAGEIAREVERVRRERDAAVPARRTRRRDRPRDVDHDHDADHRDRVPLRMHLAAGAGEPDDRAPDDRDAREHEDRALRERREMLRLPVPVLVPGSAGRPATPTAKNVSSAAIRSVPECSASESRPRLPVARPVPSLSPISAAAASTEKSAVLRCGVTAEAYAERRR